MGGGGGGSGYVASVVTSPVNESSTHTGDGAVTITPLNPTVSIVVDSPNSGVPDGANGWFKTGPVTGTVTAGHAGTSSANITSIDCSGVSLSNLTGVGTSPTASGSFSVSTEGTTDISCTATDTANLTSGPQTLTVKLDTQKPGISWAGGPADGASYYFGSVPAATTCTATDPSPGSGVNANGCAVTGYDTTVGAHTVTATASDNAGNTTNLARKYTVLPWTLKGFSSPVRMSTGSTPVWNTINGGRTVPLKFNVYAGSTQLTDPSVVAAFTLTGVACPGSTTVAPNAPFNTTGGTSLRYDRADGQFIQNWKTPATKGACYQLTMLTKDGSSVAAYFQLK